MLPVKITEQLIKNLVKEVIAERVFPIPMPFHRALDPGLRYLHKICHLHDQIKDAINNITDEGRPRFYWPWEDPIPDPNRARVAKLLFYKDDSSEWEDVMKASAHEFAGILKDIDRLNDPDRVVGPGAAHCGTPWPKVFYAE
jgi:hypothetical protein